MPEPLEFLAVTENAYDMPLVNPENLTGCFTEAGTTWVAPSEATIV